MTDRIEDMNRDEEFEKWFAESVYASDLKMPLRRAWHAALKARPEAQPHEAMHGSAPKGYKCSDCTIDQEPCPTCYTAWWRSKHPNHQEV